MERSTHSRAVEFREPVFTQSAGLREGGDLTTTFPTLDPSCLVKKTLNDSRTAYEQAP